MTHMDDVWAFTSAQEGGYTRNPKDSGNWSSGHAGVGVLVGTNMGISALTLCHWRGGPVTMQDMKNLQPSEAEAIARSMYGNVIRIEDIPPGPDVMTFELAWGSGQFFGSTALQIAVGATPDGHIGDITIGDAQTANTLAVVQAMDKLSRQHYMDDPDFPEFGVGWMARADRRLAFAKARIVNTQGIAAALG